jgi:uncharacterized protein YcgI (DUF1989 family)
VAVGKPAGGGAGRYGSLGADKPSTEMASWEDADQEEIWRTIIAVTNAGDGITLSKTRDGGALSIVLLSGDQRVRLYARGADEVSERLKEIRVQLEATD